MELMLIYFKYVNDVTDNVIIIIYLLYIIDVIYVKYYGCIQINYLLYMFLFSFFPLNAFGS
jgi:hypothetical protein